LTKLQLHVGLLSTISEFEEALEQNHCYICNGTCCRFYCKIDAYCTEFFKCTAQSHIVWVSNWRSAGQIRPAMPRFVARVMSVLC